ncbi:MAG: hypothetical protein K2N49_07275 [Ruminococcus sp.]|nr:hypothetical protein [Ruminococcus sp.]MDE7226638.1 hypothetical protein [Ruminococcus sp.]
MKVSIIELSYSCFNDCSYFLIWYEDENMKDRVYTSDGKAIVFHCENQARKKAGQLGFEAGETVFYDVERLFYWIETHSKEMDCDFLIDFWNMFSDIACSVGTELEPIKTRRIKRCYNKLFWGLNLPAVTPEDCEYEPVFTKRERKLIREIMRTGLEIFDKNYLCGDCNE